MICLAASQKRKLLVRNSVDAINIKEHLSYAVDLVLRIRIESFTIMAACYYAICLFYVQKILIRSCFKLIITKISIANFKIPG